MSQETILDELKKPFKAKEVHWRIGATNKNKVQRDSGDKFAKPTKGIALAYINSRDVMKRLDDVLGIENWQDEYIETPKGRLICKLSVRILGEWITKSDGAGETATEGEKGAISDAFKRAAVKFGVGRYLYYLPQQWVDLDKYGNFINPPMPQWALPENERGNNNG